MELLQTALVITLLTITSAKPMHYDHHDADIADKDWTQGLQDRNPWLYQLRGYSRDSSSSSSSSESSETESSESSEEIITERTTTAETTAAETTAAETTAAETTAAETTTAMTTAVMEDGSTIAPEPDTTPADMMETTQKPGTPSIPVDVTTPCLGGQCVIYDIPTGEPVTDNRGDS